MKTIKGKGQQKNTSKISQTFTNTNKNSPPSHGPKTPFRQGHLHITLMRVNSVKQSFWSHPLYWKPSLQVWRGREEKLKWQQFTG